MDDLCTSNDIGQSRKLLLRVSADRIGHYDSAIPILQRGKGLRRVVLPSLLARL